MQIEKRNSFNRLWIIWKLILENHTIRQKEGEALKDSRKLLFEEKNNNMKLHLLWEIIHLFTSPILNKIKKVYMESQ